MRNRIAATLTIILLSAIPAAHAEDDAPTSAERYLPWYDQYVKGGEPGPAAAATGD